MKGKSYNCKDLIMRCNLNEPFCGAVDDGEGTIAYVNTEVFVDEHTIGSCVYYEKRIKLRIDRVTHIVRKGDSLWAIAKKLNTSVAEIAKSNGIKDVNLIQMGDVLDINVDIRYGYQVNGMVDTMSFSPQAKEYGYTPLSETQLFKAIDTANSIVDNLGTSLVRNSGKARIGNNFRVYVENPSGRVFRGNQYVVTQGLKDIGKGITKYTQPLKAGRFAMPLAVAIEGVEIYDGYMQDGETFGARAQKQIVGAAGSIAGGVAGAALGGKIGFFVGALFGGVGAVPGAIIGGFIGGYFGGKWSEDGAEYVYDKFPTE